MSIFMLLLAFSVDALVVAKPARPPPKLIAFGNCLKMKLQVGLSLGKSRRIVDEDGGLDRYPSK
ncbi:unnamed protein product, partial [Linum tenue]